MTAKEEEEEEAKEEPLRMEPLAEEFPQEECLQDASTKAHLNPNQGRIMKDDHCNQDNCGNQENEDNCGNQDNQDNCGHQDNDSWPGQEMDREKERFPYQAQESWSMEVEEEEEEEEEERKEEEVEKEEPGKDGVKMKDYDDDDDDNDDVHNEGKADDDDDDDRSNGDEDIFVDQRMNEERLGTEKSRDNANENAIRDNANENADVNVNPGSEVKHATPDNANFNASRDMAIADVNLNAQPENVTNEEEEEQEDLKEEDVCGHKQTFSVKVRRVGAEEEEEDDRGGQVMEGGGGGGRGGGDQHVEIMERERNNELGFSLAAESGSASMAPPSCHAPSRHRTGKRGEIRKKKKKVDAGGEDAQPAVQEVPEAVKSEERGPEAGKVEVGASMLISTDKQDEEEFVLDVALGTRIKEKTTGEGGGGKG